MRKNLAAIVLMFSLFAFASAQSPLPTARTAKEKRDELDRSRGELSDLESKAADLDKALQEARKRVADATTKVNLAQKASKDADEAFQKELKELREILDASIKLMDPGSSTRTIYPKPDPKKTSGFNNTGGASDGSVIPFQIPTTGTQKTADPVPIPTGPKQPAAKEEEIITPFPEEPTTGRLVVKLNAAAKLKLNGSETSETGEIRTFRGTNLIPGKDYHYKLQITNPDQSVIDREVLVKAGHKTTVSFK